MSVAQITRRDETRRDESERIITGQGLVARKNRRGRKGTIPMGYMDGHALRLFDEELTDGQNKVS